MQELNAQELNMRIESFLTKKHQQFPELALRGAKETDTTRHTITDAFQTLVAGVKFQLNR